MPSSIYLDRLQRRQAHCLLFVPRGSWILDVATLCCPWWRPRCQVQNNLQNKCCGRWIPALECWNIHGLVLFGSDFVRHDCVFYLTKSLKTFSGTQPLRCLCYEVQCDCCASISVLVTLCSTISSIQSFKFNSTVIPWPGSLDNSLFM